MESQGGAEMTIQDLKKKRKDKEDGNGAPYRFAFVRPSCVYPNPHSPRKLIAGDALDRLTDSIRHNGILTPLIARVLRDDGWTGERYELIDGERRLQAAKALDLPSIPMLVFEDAERRRGFELSLILNTQKEPFNLFELADALDLYIKREGYLPEEAASRLSMSPKELEVKMKILELTSVDRSVILEHGLTERHARALLRVRQPGYRLFVLNTIIERGFNVTETENYIDSFLSCPEKYLITEGFSLRREPSPDGRDPPIRRVIFRDVRLFLNTLDRAVESVQASGVPVDAQKREVDDMIEYIIRVEKT